MGTNYYAIPKVTEELRKRVIEKIETGDLFEAKRMIPDSIHIGKSSSGWKFLFNHNNWEYFNKSIESLELFLTTCDIEDEYGSKISYEDFWEMVKRKDDKIDGKEYYTNWDKYNKNFATGEPIPKPSYTPKNFGEEYHFGLRFADCTEFS